MYHLRGGFVCVDVAGWLTGELIGAADLACWLIFGFLFLATKNFYPPVAFNNDRGHTTDQRLSSLVFDQWLIMFRLNHGPQITVWLEVSGHRQVVAHTLCQEKWELMRPIPFDAK